MPSPAPLLISPFAATAEAPQPPDLAARIAAVQQIADPHLRQATEANIRLRTQREIGAFTDQQRSAKSQAKAIIDQGGDLGTIPAKLILAIDKDGRQALYNYALAHGSPRTDPVTYYDLKNQALDDPTGFQSVDLGNHMAELDARDYGDLTKLQNDLRNGQLPADFPLQQVYKAQTDRLLQQLGLPSGHPDNDAAADSTTATQETETQGTATSGNVAAARLAQERAARLRQDIDRQISAHQIATNQKQTPAQFQDYLNGILSRQLGTQNATPAALPGSVAANIGNAAAIQALPKPGAGELGDATELLWKSYALPALRAGAGLVEGVGAGTVLGAAAGFAAGMWPKSTAAPELDELQGAQTNESSKKRFRQEKKKDQKSAPTTNTPPAGSSPPPDQQGPQEPTPPVFKRPNDPLQPNDRIDLSKFTKRIKSGRSNSPYLEDEVSGYRIQPDKGLHGGREWKLFDRLGKRIGSLSADGKYLAK
ncbi:MAG TPA: hypothetical protein VL462_00565 [Candidatus Nitrosotalea sp.]|nr:hypothetical protein [Candidatus Nitrosotalea sp.]